MAKATCTDEEFIALVETLGPTKTAKQLGVTDRSIYQRRARIERTSDRPIVAPVSKNNTRFESDYPNRLNLDLPNGRMLIMSDCHYYPGYESVVHRGYVYLAKLLNIDVTVLDGDVFDFPKISRHAPIGWNKKPRVQEEKEEVENRLHEICQAAPRAKRFWLMGNHDYRFENRLSERVPEYDGVAGFRLSDHFALWTFGISLWINDNAVIKHRWKGGEHAVFNNTIRAGKTMGTGHLHSLKVVPFTDYNGTRFGCDFGTAADIYGPHTDYMEDNPRNWCAGGQLWTFKDGRLLWPEIFRSIDKDHIEFRGEVIKV